MVELFNGLYLGLRRERNQVALWVVGHPQSGQIVEVAPQTKLGTGATEGLRIGLGRAVFFFADLSLARQTGEKSFSQICSGHTAEDDGHSDNEFVACDNWLGGWSAPLGEGQGIEPILIGALIGVRECQAAPLSLLIAGGCFG